MFGYKSMINYYIGCILASGSKMPIKLVIKKAEKITKKIYNKSGEMYQKTKLDNVLEYIICIIIFSFEFIIFMWAFNRF